MFAEKFLLLVKNFFVLIINLFIYFIRFVFFNSVTYIPEEAAIAYRKSIKQDSHSSVESSPVAALRRTSPR